MAAYISWFNRIRTGAIRQGLMIGENRHYAKPIPYKKGFRQVVCPKCGSKSAFLFRSEQKEDIVISFCSKCNKWAWAKATKTQVKKLKEAVDAELGNIKWNI